LPVSFPVQIIYRIVSYIPRWFTCPQTVTHPGTDHLIATPPGVEPTTSRSYAIKSSLS